ncbi:OmpA family protein [Sphingobium sp. AEW4]|uniref:OmpA family protein n=1 Tax=Sphingobium sp. AEW4 TaxID=2116625 RepID=UPI000D16C496|nr:OmpA family protein [Sphingobium sp. AEW4]PSO10058.1 flagellar motor protein MotB [Sphingobium sp. AEW4]
MRKLALAAALATTALATPAMARDDSWYVGVDAGVLLVEDQDMTFSAVPAGGRPVPSIDYHKGYDFDANIGYDFGGFRLEAEAAYKRAKIDLDKTGGGFGGAASALSFMLNGLLDFGPDDGLQGFVGGGVGVSRGKVASDIVNDSDTGFAWQAIAGVRYPVTNNVDVSLKYRFFNQDDLKLIPAYTTPYGVAGSTADTKLRTHSLLLGLTYNFGEPAAPPPPPPPVAECSPGPYIVFFEWDKSDVTPDAATILDNAVSAYSNCGSAQVMLAGYADKSGSASYNVGLSQRRADAVKAYMASKGIPDGVMTTQAFGESNPRVETADGVRELQNRRVEITYGPGSGM